MYERFNLSLMHWTEIRKYAKIAYKISEMAAINENQVHMMKAWNACVNLRDEYKYRQAIENFKEVEGPAYSICRN